MPDPSPLDNQIAILRAEIELHEAAANRTHPMAETFHALRNLAAAKRAELQRLERTRPVVCDLTKNDEITRVVALEAQLAAPVGVEELVEMAARIITNRVTSTAEPVTGFARAVARAVAPLIAAAEREKVAAFMMQHSLATGHGDTIEDLLVELGGQIEDLRAAAIRGGEGE